MSASCCEALRKHRSYASRSAKTHHSLDSMMRTYPPTSWCSSDAGSHVYGARSTQSTYDRFKQYTRSRLRSVFKLRHASSNVNTQQDARTWYTTLNVILSNCNSVRSQVVLVGQRRDHPDLVVDYCLESHLEHLDRQLALGRYINKLDQESCVASDVTGLVCVVTYIAAAIDMSLKLQ